MATPRSAWGIDVGNRALKAVKVVRGAEGLRVDDVAVLEHEHILSNAGDNKESLIQAALQQFVQTHSTKGAAIAIGVSGQQSFAKFIKLPPVEEKQVPNIVRFEAIQQIPFPLDDVEWAYQLFRDENSPDVEVGIFAMRKELVNQHIGHFSNVGVDVHVVQTNPLAVYNAMYYDQRLKGTTMIIDIGAENTDLIIGDGEAVWMRSIPIGGNQFTESLTKSFKLRFDKAEELKRNAATSKYARQILQAMRPVFADLVSEIQRSIGFYSSVHRDSRIQRVLALGGTFRLPGLQKYLQQNLQLEVHRVDRLGAGAPDNAQAAAIFNENLLSTISAYGLALQALGEAKITSSLLPGVIKRERMWRDKTKWFAAAAALFVAGAAIPIGRLYYEQFNFDKAQAEYDPKIKPVEARAVTLDRKWAEIEQQGGADRMAIENVKSIESGRDVWAHLIQDITSGLPDPGPDVKSGDPDRIKKVPRNKRLQVKIEQLGSRYEPNLTAVLADEATFRAAAGSLVTEAAPAGGSRTGGPGMSFPTFPQMGAGASAEGEAAAQPEVPERGFIIGVRLTTPYANAGELGENIQNALRAKAGQVGKGASYKIVRVAVTSAAKLPPTAPAAANAHSMRPGLPAVGPRRPAAPAAPPPGTVAPPVRPGARFESQPGDQAADTFVDPVTGESLKDDWQLTLLVAAVLDPKPPAPPAEGQAAADQ
jgi:type IV pilus assembly protein PilM